MNFADGDPLLWGERSPSVSCARSESPGEKVCGYSAAVAWEMAVTIVLLWVRLTRRATEVRKTRLPMAPSMLRVNDLRRLEPSVNE